MKNIDLLMTPPQPARVSGDFLADMGVDCLKSLLAPAEYDIFVDVLKLPLTDPAAICERQRVLSDLSRYPELTPRIIAVCERMAANKIPIYGAFRTDPIKRKIEESLRIVNTTFDCIGELADALKYKQFTAAPLAALTSQLLQTNRYEDIRMRLAATAQWIKSDDISLEVEYGVGFKLKGAAIYSRCDASRPAGLGRRQANPNEEPYGHDFIACLQAENFLESAGNNLSSYLTAVNSYAVSFARNLARQLTFYAAAIKIANRIRFRGCPAVVPAMLPGGGAVRAEELCELGLAVRDLDDEKELVANDFTGEPDSFYLISGANQGGKTIFIKSLGMAQLFAQNGLTVPAGSYTAPVYHGFASHFPRDEDTHYDYGKLAEELTRFRENLPVMAGRALVFLNESFATTTERDGCTIASDVLRALASAEECPALFFVTHNYRLLSGMDELNKQLDGVTLRSLVTQPGENAAGRTYKIVPGPPQKRIYAIEFLKERVGV